MAINYTTLATKAAALISQAGRSITLVQLSKGSTDAGKPWLGPDAGNDRSTPIATVAVKAVAVPPSGADALGFSAAQQELLKDVEQIFIIEAGAGDLEKYNVIRDGNVDYKITFIEKLRPATTTLIYFFGVRR